MNSLYELCCTRLNGTGKLATYGDCASTCGVDAWSVDREVYRRLREISDLLVHSTVRPTLDE